MLDSPPSNRRLTTPVWPLSEASCRAVLPEPLFISTSALWSTRNLDTSRFPSLAVLIRQVESQIFLVLILAPAARSRFSSSMSTSSSSTPQAAINFLSNISCFSIFLRGEARCSRRSSSIFFLSLNVAIYKGEWPPLFFISGSDPFSKGRKFPYVIWRRLNLHDFSLKIK